MSKDDKMTDGREMSKRAPKKDDGLEDWFVHGHMYCLAHISRVH